MKKYILIFATLFCIAFAGCSKEENGSDSLVGTVWEFYEEYNEDGNNDYYSAQLHFTTDSDVKITEKYNDYEGRDRVETAMAKYSYNHPMIVVYDNDVWDELFFILQGDGRLYCPDEDWYFVKK